jgi:2-dehydro-3-deoxyglucarate aldolase
MNPNSGSPNVFRQQLIERQRVVGCWLSLASPIATEVVGVAGFDWLLLDCEHAPNDVLSIVPQLMALKDSASAAVVRPPWNDAVVIKRLLDVGAQNLLVPFIETAEQAAHVVAATRYPPEGIRGVSVSHRGNRYGAVSDYWVVANRSISVGVQIENRSGVANAATIAAVDGVDALFVGPSDLAAAYGHLGNAAHPEVQAAIAEVLAAAQTAGKAAGILAPAEADARRYLDMGFTMVAVGSDLGLLRSNSQQLADKFKTLG